MASFSRFVVYAVDTSYGLPPDEDGNKRNTPIPKPLHPKEAKL
jgi:hypothetical protein